MKQLHNREKQDARKDQDVPVRFRVADARALSADFQGGFDFVVDTFGLCAHSAPVEVLKVNVSNFASEY